MWLPAALAAATEPLSRGGSGARTEATGTDGPVYQAPKEAGIEIQSDSIFLESAMGRRLGPGDEFSA